MKKTVKDYLFVGVQILLFFALLGDLEELRFEAVKTVRIIGGILFFIGFVISAIAVLQLNRNLSPFPSPKPGAHLIKNGLYKYIRHPIYSGILIAGIGLGLVTASGSRLIVVVLLGILFYYKSQYEEDRMRKIYPDYPEYMKTTGRFFIRF